MAANKANLHDEKTQIKLVADAYIKTFDNVAPHCVAVAPGRINLIGEHVDYCGFSVLPFPTQHAIFVAIGFGNKPNTIHFSNVDSDTYPPKTIIIHPDAEDLNHLTTLQLKQHWTNYPLCPIMYLSKKILPIIKQFGLNIKVHSCLPAAAGLSSSSALVVATLLAVSAILPPRNTLHSVETDRDARASLAKFAAEAERLSGVSGGAMDQAAILSPPPQSFDDQEKHVGTASYISLFSDTPSVRDAVSLPCELEIVMANSLTKAEKAATSHYNVRVFETLVGAILLLIHAKKQFAQDEGFQKVNACEMYNIFENKVLRLADTVSVLMENRCLDTQSSMSMEEYIETVLLNANPGSFFGDSALIDSGMSLSDIYAAVDCKDIMDHILTKSNLPPEVAEKMTFYPHKRTRHVLSEVVRTHAVVRLLQNMDRGSEIAGSCSEEDDLELLGKLINETHRSLDEDYDASCPTVQELIDTGVNSCGKVLGARCVGAGWGGFVMFLTKRGDCALENALKQFYAKRSSASSCVEYFKVERVGRGARLYTFALNTDPEEIPLCQLGSL